MKRYALFGGEDYYAAGGFHDLISTYDTEEGAESAAEVLIKSSRRDSIEWWHIYDCRMRKIVSFSGFAYGAPDDKPNLDK